MSTRSTKAKMAMKKKTEEISYSERLQASPGA
jgi:hypothetical protein